VVGKNVVAKKGIRIAIRVVRIGGTTVESVREINVVDDPDRSVEREVVITAKVLTNPAMTVAMVVVVLTITVDVVLHTLDAVRA
jgi:hypothetical protein